MHQAVDLRFAQQPRQLGEVHCQPPRLVAGQQLGREAPTWFLLEIEVAERLPVGGR